MFEENPHHLSNIHTIKKKSTPLLWISNNGVVFAPVESGG
jgi:hypothetical protein